MSEDVTFVEIDGVWYHQTNRGSVRSILEEGFYIEHGWGDQRFTEGVYFLNHKGAHYGEVTLACEVKGKFLDLHDEMGNRWKKFIGDNYWNKMPYNNYEELTKAIRKDYPDADGVSFGHMLVVWDAKNIAGCKEL